MIALVTEIFSVLKKKLLFVFVKLGKEMSTAEVRMLSITGFLSLLNTFLCKCASKLDLVQAVSVPCLAGLQ